MQLCDHLPPAAVSKSSLGRLSRQACIRTVLAMLTMCRQVCMYAQALLSGSLFNFPYEGEAQEEDRNCGLAHGVETERYQ